MEVPQILSAAVFLQDGPCSTQTEVVSEGVELWKLIILTIKNNSANNNDVYGYNLLNTEC